MVNPIKRASHFITPIYKLKVDSFALKRMIEKDSELGGKYFSDRVVGLIFVSFIVKKFNILYIYTIYQSFSFFVF